jgi:hypothetical protein
MHLYRLIVAAICLQQMLCANSQQHGFTLNAQHLATGLAMLHGALSFFATMLERILPTVEAMMPDKAPLIIWLLIGCNGLAIRIPYGLADGQTTR